MNLGGSPSQLIFHERMEGSMVPSHDMVTWSLTAFVSRGSMYALSVFRERGVMVWVTSSNSVRGWSSEALRIEITMTVPMGLMVLSWSWSQ